MVQVAQASSLFRPTCILLVDRGMAGWEACQTNQAECLNYVA